MSLVLNSREVIRQNWKFYLNNHSYKYAEIF